MHSDVKTYAAKLRQVPPVPCDLAVGDRVTFTNEFGVSFVGMKVIGFAEDDGFYGRFIHITGPEHAGAYWFPHKPSELKKEAAAKVASYMQPSLQPKEPA
ncbi:hypothetical protein [Aquamicrobium sp.]|uniref:hypothetical protein n=1 Tax=Aquamicrobium sp. TaxID=1872579 RepID=UPI0025889F65|nr:hypothetical protein [Aquamicrobium sp.]MCK9554134.1 hypothetical protein [Aquamicrobium sp.]